MIYDSLSFKYRTTWTVLATFYSGSGS